jgi:tetratricopeptide (TPR) repeat protein
VSNRSKETLTLQKAAFAALLTLAVPIALAAPVHAQDQAPAAAAPAPAAAAPAAAQMTPEQIAAFNKAVTDFTAGQTAQQAGDNAGAIAKYEAALPAIRTAVQTQPDKIDNVNFLANALYADAAANGALGKMDQVIALYGESVPHWRKVVAAKPTDAASRNILAGILVQMGNQKLGAKDNGGADPFYQEALGLARKSVAENGSDPINKNILLSALIGASQTGSDAAIKTEAVAMSKAMLADGSVDATNKPAAQAMSGAPAAG